MFSAASGARTKVKQILDGVVAHVQQRGDQLKRTRRIAALLDVWTKKTRNNNNQIKMKNARKE